MPDHDAEILILISEKESDFAKEIARLASLSETEDLSAELSDYLSGLSDLKNDFLLPMLKKISDRNENAKTLLADKHWYYKRV